LGRAVAHVYPSIAMQTRGEGCLTHAACTGAQHSADGLVGGPPCQPFTRFRAGRFSNAPPTSHPGYGATFGDGSGDSFLEALAHDRPAFFVFENVLGFSLAHRGDTSTPLDIFLADVMKIRADTGKPLYTVQVVKMDSATWVELPRERYGNCQTPPLARRTHSHMSVNTCAHQSNTVQTRIHTPCHFSLQDVFGT
jgi:hypothetical protein